MMSDEEKKNPLGRPEGLFENVIFMKISKNSKFFLKLQNTFYITFGVFRCAEDLWMLEKPL